MAARSLALPSAVKELSPASGLSAVSGFLPASSETRFVDLELEHPLMSPVWASLLRVEQSATAEGAARVQSFGAAAVLRSEKVCASSWSYFVFGVGVLSSVRLVY